MSSIVFGLKYDEFRHGPINTEQQSCFGKQWMSGAELLCCVYHQLHAALAASNSPYLNAAIIGQVKRQIANQSVRSVLNCETESIERFVPITPLIVERH